MVITIIAYIIGLFITVIAFVLPEWQLWPEEVFTAIDYFFSNLINLNNILIVVPDILLAIVFVMKFLFWFGIFLIVRKLFNYIRGTGQGI
jgi:hypothetical protein